MSSFIRSIQRSINRKKHYLGRGSKLGVPVKQDAKDLVARLKREKKGE